MVELVFQGKVSLLWSRKLLDCRKETANLNANYTEKVGKGYRVKNSGGKEGQAMVPLCMRLSRCLHFSRCLVGHEFSYKTICDQFIPSSLTSGLFEGDPNQFLYIVCCSATVLQRWGTWDPQRIVASRKAQLVQLEKHKARKWTSYRAYSWSDLLCVNEDTSSSTGNRH